jgi:hypothetical protein
LNRYGQKAQVEVTLMLNPSTVEARIWKKLDEKIKVINEMLANAMEEPEDMEQLVLGMVPDGFFRQVFEDGIARAPDLKTETAFSRWFDTSTARFGGEDVRKVVQDLVGNAARFDFQRLSSQLPDLDLADLKPFLLSMLQWNRRKVSETTDGLSFKTPDLWESVPGVKRHYERLIFERKSGQEARPRIVGVGHRVLDLALQQARVFEAMLTRAVPDYLSAPLVLFKVFDRVTDTDRTLRQVIVGVELGESEQVLPDWRIVQLLNRAIELRHSRENRPPPSDAGTDVAGLVERAHQVLQSTLSTLDLPFRIPDWLPLLILA